MSRRSRIVLSWVIITFAILLSFIYFLTPFYFDVIYPSYASVSIVCGANTNNITELVSYANSIGFGVAGAYNPSTDTIYIVNDTVDPFTMKHENCHRKQANENRSYDCDFKFGLFLNEVEAYYCESRNCC